MSLQTRFWRLFLRLTFKGSRLTIEEDRIRSSKNASTMNRVPAGVAIENFEIAGLPAQWISLPVTKPEKIIFHLHGGGYVTSAIDAYQMMGISMAQTLGRKVLLPEYRRAPEHPFPAALEDALAAYRWLLGQGYKPVDILMSGDSAGGGLCLAVVQALRAAGEPLPAALLVMSPWTDLTFQGQSHASRAKAEVILKTDLLREWAAFYFGKENPANPLISPVYADFHGFPPLLIQVGSQEILLDDARMLAERANAHGVSVTLKVWDGMWHVWQALGDLIPETRQAFEEVGRFLYSHDA
jgi:monoterpene epsilon-lactone hydrolase